MFKTVYAYPILPGKSERLHAYVTDRAKNASNQLYQEQLAAYRKVMGWSQVHTWFQTLPGGEYQILLIKSENQLDSNKIYSNFRSRCDSGCSIAKAVREIYLETVGLDFYEREAYPASVSLAHFSGEFSDEKETEDYAFGYPIINGKKELIVNYHRDILAHPEKLAAINELHKRLGIVENQIWIQNASWGEMVLFFQKIVSPVEKARDGWREGVKTEKLMQRKREVFGEATGLSSEELLPTFVEVQKGR